MGKQKQQVISRFFAPKPKTPTPQNPPSSQSPTPKVSATVTFSPSKRLLSTPSPSSSSSKPPKLPKLSDPSLHQKFLDKLLEPTTPTSSATQQEPSNPSKYTPLERQVSELKEKYPDVLLMVEVGYKYRFFGEDAETAARVLGIYAHVDRSFLTASVPTFRLGVHVRRLVAAGHKVGVVRQTETAAIKARGPSRGGPFGRGLSALYTRATVEAAAELGGGEGGEGWGGDSNYLVCVVEEEGEECGVRVGVVGVEISTGDVVYGEFGDGFLRTCVEAFVLSLAPSELLLGLPLSKQTEKVTFCWH